MLILLSHKRQPPRPTMPRLQLETQQLIVGNVSERDPGLGSGGVMDPAGVLWLPAEEELRAVVVGLLDDWSQGGVLGKVLLPEKVTGLFGVHID